MADAEIDKPEHYVHVVPTNIYLAMHEVGFPTTPLATLHPIPKLVPQDKHVLVKSDMTYPGKQEVH